MNMKFKGVALAAAAMALGAIMTTTAPTSAEAGGSYGERCGFGCNTPVHNYRPRPAPTLKDFKVTAYGAGDALAVWQGTEGFAIAEKEGKASVTLNGAGNGCAPTCGNLTWQAHVMEKVKAQASAFSDKAGKPAFVANSMTAMAGIKFGD